MKKTNDLKQSIKVTMKATIEEPEDHIVFQVVNTEKNQDMLKKAPHRRFLDLSIIYALTNEFGQSLYWLPIRLQRHMVGARSSCSKWQCGIRNRYFLLR